MLTIAAAAASEAPPAGGAAVAQVIGASIAMSLLVAALLVLGQGHRSGRIQLLERASGVAARNAGLPGWAALPAAITGVSLLAAVIGFYWDVSIHIDQGRDEGPLANPSHYFILLGLYGIFAAGWLALVLPRERPGPAALRLTRDWHAPVGGLLLMACASFALLGFPLDDVSHRLFGQDVTLWGPTHLMMLGGAALSLVAVLVLIVEGRLAAAAAEDASGPRAVRRAEGLRLARLVSACGGLLVGLSIFQAEFDFGVPQFRLLFEPLMIAFAAALGLVVARTLIGRGGALAAVAFFLVLRGLLTLLVGPLLGEATTHFPLYLAEALLVEAVALRIRPGSYRFGLAAGALVGTLGVVAEWGWSHVWMPLAWPAHALPGAIAVALPVALAGGVLGTFVAGALSVRPQLVGSRRAWAAAGASLLVVALAIAVLLPTTVPQARAQIALSPAPGPSAGGSEDGMVNATIRFDPPSAVRDPDWLLVLGWQGGAPLVVDRLRHVGGGVYETSAPVPVGGTWKTIVRLQRGSDLAAIPISLPADAAIPSPAVPARPQMTRPFTSDLEVLQRERKTDVPTWLWGAAGLVVLGCTAALLLAIGWGLVRLGRSGAPPQPPAAERTPSAARASAAGRIATA